MRVCEIDIFLYLLSPLLFNPELVPGITATVSRVYARLQFKLWVMTVWGHATQCEDGETLGHSERFMNAQ